jgi:GT2 family glycosyltransferase
MRGRLSGSVTVVIVSYESADWLPRCLAALPKALPRHRWRVVVVDNASSDGSAEVADRLGALIEADDVHLLHVRSLAAVGPVARGIEQAAVAVLHRLDRIFRPACLVEVAMRQRRMCRTKRVKRLFSAELQLASVRHVMGWLR